MKLPNLLAIAFSSPSKTLTRSLASGDTRRSASGSALRTIASSVGLTFAQMLASSSFTEAIAPTRSVSQGLSAVPLAMVRMLPRLAGYSKPPLCQRHGATILKGWLGNSTRIAIAQTQTPTVTYASGKYQLKAPDWSHITWANLPPVQQPGYLSVPPDIVSKFGYNPSRSWSAGQKVDSIVMLGDVEDAFKLSSLSLKAISAIVPIAPNTTLKNFGLMQWQTPQSLVKAIPGLGNQDISQVPPMKDLLTKAGVFSSGTISQVLQSNPQAATLPLGKLDLSQYSINSIPQLSQTQIGNFLFWQQSFINQVPNLNQVPFDKMPQKVSSGTDLVGVASVVLGKAEQGDAKANSNYFISGSVNRSNSTVPVACEAVNECAYMELGDLAGSGGSLYGKRWVSGSSQKVKGGFGILGGVNGGIEPTGRLVYGPAFKVVLTGVNESTGTADFGLFMRICADIPFAGRTCTPYFIGPVPWIPVKENDLVIVGAR